MGQVHDLITKDMTISEVIEKYPSTIETLLMTGVHCIGCHVSYFETLEQGMKGHGMTDEEIDDVIKEMNNVVKEEKLSNNEDYKITEKTASKIKEVIKDKDGLRIEVIPGGCSGYMYNITTEDKINNDDKVFEEKGVKAILDKESLDLLK